MDSIDAIFKQALRCISCRDFRNRRTESYQPSPTLHLGAGEEGAGYNLDDLMGFASLGPAPVINHTLFVVGTPFSKLLVHFKDCLLVLSSPPFAAWRLPVDIKLERDLYLPLIVSSILQNMRSEGAFNHMSRPLCYPGFHLPSASPRS